ncbi:MAG: thymidine phosphorylase [Lentisphaerae bacterium]|nr:thymidine phosphorylase [Lentisphaerota bacterium]
MLPQWIIEKKRDNEELTDTEIQNFISGFVSGSVTDYQASAFAMAVYFNGMSPDETAALTEAIMWSGSIVDTSSIRKPIIDKHSTGGIGDKVSIVLAPLVASCDIAVPMIAGRGLGITGGTLDKLESIAGYQTEISEHDFLKIVNECGCAIIGQTAEIAPADKRLYAIRDVTGTVPSIPLITASILGKKLAAGIDGLVMDVKSGRGAFMKTRADAKKLAESISSVGARLGKPVKVLITNMDRPLGRTVGNSLEIIESIETLKGNGPVDLTELTLELAAQMLMLAKRAESRNVALTLLNSKLKSGEALEVFSKMVTLQGGDPACVDDYGVLPQAPIKHMLLSKSSGYITDVDPEKIGRASLLLGAGRSNADDTINHSVGLSEIKQIGEPISKDEPLAIVHAADDKSLSAAMTLLEQSFEVQTAQPEQAELIHEVLETKGVGIEY